MIYPLPAGASEPSPIVKLNYQHAFVRPDDPTFLTAGAQVRVGISHPCTTLDMWRVLLVVDDEYNVIDTATTVVWDGSQPECVVPGDRTVSLGVVIWLVTLQW